MFRRLFGRVAPPQPDTSAWWQEAEALSAAPEAAAIARLQAAMVDPATSPDLAEEQEEMIDGLSAVLPLVQNPALPVVPTQHRVIGQTVCHFLAPASLIDQVDAAGKLFVTADRLVFAAGTVQQWPWHSISGITRVSRDVVVDVRGRPGAAHLRLNSYGDAMHVQVLAQRLRANRP